MTGYTEFNRLLAAFSVCRWPALCLIAFPKLRAKIQSFTLAEQALYMLSSTVNKGTC